MCEQRDTGDQAAHAVEFLNRQGPGRLHFGLLACVQYLQLASDDGDRGFELVPDVVEQALLVQRRFSQAIKHVVDGFGEVRHIVASGDRDTFDEVDRATAADGRIAQQTDRAEQSAGDEPRD